jgi:pilus assembly protein FimV
MKRIPLILLACLSLVSLPSFAESLGRLTVISDLDQPLIAEIELHGVNATDLAQYSAQLASEQAYRIQGIEKTPPQNSIRVEVVRKFDNSPVLKLTSSQALHSRSTNILVQLDWPSGRVMREYALLLEPSQVSNSAPAPIDSVVFTRNRVQPPAEVAEAAKSPAKPDAPAATPATPSAANEAVKPKTTVAAVEPPAGGYSTNKGDTLSKIARRMQVDGVSLDQMLQALYLANKEAFIDGDINKLKAEVELKPPSAADFASALAAPAVTAQSEDWRSYRNQAANLVKESEANETGAEQVPQTGKLAKVEDKAVPATGGAKDVLKLSRTDLIDEKWLSREAQFEQEKQALEEEVTVRENRLEDANQRIVELEKQVRDLNLLLEKNRQAATQQPPQGQLDWLAFASPLREALKQPSDGLLAAIGIGGLLLLMLILRAFSGRKSGALQRREPTV